MTAYSFTNGVDTVTVFSNAEVVQARFCPDRVRLLQLTVTGLTFS
jgi:hypothetical protein